MDEEKLVSVIIPIYNAEENLEHCLNSLIAQTYRNIQIVLVNDGSEDKSEEICLRFVKNDSRITYVYQKNNGVGSARNNGIWNAEGEYVCFVDADDYVYPQFVEILLNSIEENEADMAICGFSEIKDNIIVNQTKGDVQIMSQQDAMVNLMREDGFKGYVWNKLFRKDIIQEHKIEFDTSISVWEDVLFDFQYMLCVNKIVYNSTPLYYYIYNHNSSSHERNHILGEEKAYSVIRAQKEIEKLIPKEYYDVKEQLSVRYVQSALAVIRNIGYLRKGKKSCYYRDSVEIIKNYRKVAHNLLGKKDKILVFMVLFFPDVLLLMYKIK